MRKQTDEDSVSSVESQVTPEIREEFEGSTMSKAGKLAMELNKERKRLKEEMEVLQTEVDDLKPATPTGTVDSYVKWVATVFGVVGVFLISAGLSTLGQCAYLLAAVSWVYVGHCWNDKAIMIGSAVSGTAVLMNIVKVII